MIEFDDSEHLSSNFTDTTIQFILDMYGPVVKDMLLTKWVVVRVPLDDESR